MADKTYRTVHGFVGFPPREGEAGGKPVRNISIRQAGFKEQAVNVSATLWPSHAHVQVSEGDLVTVEGAYTQNSGTKQDGSPVTYHNLSVSRISVNGGRPDAGRKPDVENTYEDVSTADDEIPF